MTPDELKRRRDRLGLTQAELAERLGVMRNTIARWEIGRDTEGHRRIPEMAVRLLDYIEREAREKRAAQRQRQRKER